MDIKNNLFGELTTLESEIVSCRRCPRLVSWRETIAQQRKRSFHDQEYWGKPVPGFGDPAARLIVVGLAPGAHGSNRTGRMFTGDASGVFLYAALNCAGFANQAKAINRMDGLSLRDVFITAICRCVPPDNKPSHEEVTNCLPYLARELDLLKPHGIVALGHIAFDGLLALYTRRDDRISRQIIQPFGHGVFNQFGTNNLPWLLASYHPSRQNTQTGRLTPAMFDAVWNKAKELLESI